MKQLIALGAAITLGFSFCAMFAILFVTGFCGLPHTALNIATGICLTSGFIALVFRKELG